MARLPYLTLALGALIFLVTTMVLLSRTYGSITLLSLLSSGLTSEHPLPGFSNGQAHQAPASDQDQLGAVASESTICSSIGIGLLRRGGNAADALVGTTFCTGVIGMYHSGIGGGGFALVRDSEGQYESIDFRETAPGAAFQDMYNHDPSLSVRGGLASGVPGEVRGMAYLHEKYGRLPWKEVMQGAIQTARNGFPVTEDLQRAMSAATSGDHDDFLVNDPEWAIDFAPNGTLLKLGDIITRKRYANTLEAIAVGGPDAFHTGSIAESMINSVQRANGTMTLEDLANYTVVVRPTSEIDYRGYKVRSCSAPASGAVALSILKIIEGYETIGQEGWRNLSTHRLDEAMRFAYGQRTTLGDPSFIEGIDEYEADMLNASTATLIRGRISDQHTLDVSAYNPDGLEVLDTPGTSHVVTADASGVAISMTTTINLFFGSQLIVPETGIIMNDEMNDFSIPGSRNDFGFPPSPSNYIAPGKRPFSSITPTIVEFPNGTLYLVTGAAGGSRIITATVQSIWNVLDRNMTVHDALAEPRVHDQLIPNQAWFEYSYDNSTVEFMKDRGHNVTWVPPFYSSAQALRRLTNGTFEAAGEPRQKNSGGFAV